MRKLLLFVFSFLLVTVAIAQQKDGVIKVRKKQNTIPMIAGVAGGEIEGSLLCAGEGIVINKNMTVKSFVLKVDYGSKEMVIKHNGNKLSQEACDIIAVLKSGAQVYINEIAVEDNKGREALATPMRFTLK